MLLLKILGSGIPCRKCWRFLQRVFAFFDVFVQTTGLSSGNLDRQLRRLCESWKESCGVYTTKGGHWRCEVKADGKLEWNEQEGSAAQSFHCGDAAEGALQSSQCSHQGCPEAVENDILSSSKKIFQIRKSKNPPPIKAKQGDVIQGNLFCPVVDSPSEHGSWRLYACFLRLALCGETTNLRNRCHH